MLYLVDCDALADRRLYDKYYALLNPVRRAKTDALGREADRRRSVGAFAALKIALSDVGAEDGEWIYDALGKPHIVGAPYFSLSHSGRYALCALSESEVGCDVQKRRKISDGLAKRVLSAENYALYRSLGGEAACDFFFTAWTVAESFLKMTGAGLSGGLNAVTYDKCGGLSYRGEPLDAIVSTFRAGEGYFVACCSRLPVGELADVTSRL